MVGFPGPASATLACLAAVGLGGLWWPTAQPPPVGAPAGAGQVPSRPLPAAPGPTEPAPAVLALTAAASPSRPGAELPTQAMAERTTVELAAAALAMPVLVQPALRRLHEPIGRPQLRCRSFQCLVASAASGTCVANFSSLATVEELMTSSKWREGYRLSWQGSVANLTGAVLQPQPAAAPREAAALTVAALCFDLLIALPLCLLRRLFQGWGREEKLQEEFEEPHGKSGGEKVCALRHLTEMPSPRRQLKGQVAIFGTFGPGPEEKEHFHVDGSVSADQGAEDMSWLEGTATELATASPQVPRVVRRGATELAEVLQRKRGQCKEWQSAPVAIRTDAHAEEKKEFGGGLPGSNVGKAEEAASTTVEASARRRLSTTNEQLQEWMSQRRSQCLVTALD